MRLAKIIFCILVSFWGVTALWCAISYWSFRRREKLREELSKWHLELPRPRWDLPYAIPPLLVISWCTYSVLFRPPYKTWNLPSSWWYGVSASMAILILLIEYLSRRNK